MAVRRRRSGGREGCTSVVQGFSTVRGTVHAGSGKTASGKLLVLLLFLSLPGAPRCAGLCMGKGWAMAPQVLILRVRKKLFSILRSTCSSHIQGVRECEWMGQTDEFEG